MVARDGVEPPTPAFSGLRSTTCATWPLSWDTPASRSLRRDRRKMLRGPATLQCGKNATSIPREVAIIIATRFETLNSSAPGTRRPWALRAHRSQVSDTHAGVTCGSVFGRGCPAFCNATQHNPQCVAPAIYFPEAAPRCRSHPASSGDCRALRSADFLQRLSQRSLRGWNAVSGEEILHFVVHLSITKHACGRHHFAAGEPAAHLIEITPVAAHEVPCQCRAGGVVHHSRDQA